MRMASSRQVITLITASLTLIGVTSNMAGLAQPAPPPQELQLRPLPETPARSARPGNVQPDILLVMVKSGADREEVADLLRESHGTVIQTIGEGPMTTIVVQCEKGKLDETERKFSQDNHFSNISRNPLGEAMDRAGRGAHGGTKSAGSDQNPSPLQTSSAAVVNDPYFPSEWHLAALNVPAAWTASTGKGVIVGIADTGSQASNPDLAGRTYAGIDIVKASGSGNVDQMTNGSHGTCTATTAAATSNNRALTASPASGCYVFPLRISWSSGGDGSSFTTSDQQLINAIDCCIKNRIKILNISYGSSNVASSFANPKYHSVLHQWLKSYHDDFNGLAIFSAGNSAQFDSNPRLPYMMMVSALDTSYRLASFSNYGNCIWFTAPGTSIQCSNRDGRAVSMNGTSFSAPLIASLCGMIWAKNPSMKNTQVEQALINSCRSPGGKGWSTQFGYGLPDIASALNASYSRPTYSRGIGDDDGLSASDQSENEPKHEGSQWALESTKETTTTTEPATESKPEELSSPPIDKPSFPTNID